MQLLKDRRGDDAEVAIVANKTDLEEKRAVTFEEGSEKAKQHGAFFVEVSARSGDKVFDLFRTLTDTLLQGENGHLGPDTDIKLNIPKKGGNGKVVKRRKKCCK